MSDNDQVKLKPIMGVEPGKYLLILYSVIIAAVLFFLLFFPGIIRPGTVYSFNSIPENAVVYIDGKYQGATPCKVFVPEGKHSVSIEKKYFNYISDEIISKNRIFGSLFSPKKENFSVTVDISDPEGFFSNSFREFAEWCMIDSFFDNYQPKPVIGPLFRDLQASGYNNTAELSGFLYSVIPFIHNEILYKDFLDAVVIFEEIKSGDSLNVKPGIVSSFTELSFFQDSVKFFENLPFWFYSLLSDENRENNVKWYPALQEEYGSFLRDFSNDFPAPQAAVTVNGMRFLMLSGGQFLIGADGNNFPYPAAVDDFMIMDREVTNDLYRLFLSENPDWRLENKDKLISDGLVNQDYLKDFDISEDNVPVNFISWFAADSFCNWLESKLPPYLSEYTVRLPDDHEWEWAALTESDSAGIFNDSSANGPLTVDGRYPGNSGFYDLKGNLWEWCDNWYAPASALITSRNPAYNEVYYGKYPGVEKSVRGGSWANDDNISISTRGSQPPEWCTEFLGFRPVLVKE